MIIIQLIAAAGGALLIVWGLWRWTDAGQPNVWIAVFERASSSRLPVLAMIAGFFLVSWGVMSLLI